MKSNIGLKIKAARKRKGLTQRELGIRIGKGFSTIQKYEYGLVEPPMSVILDIARELGITPVQLAETVIQWPDELHADPDPCRERLLAAYEQLDPLWREKAAERVEELAELFRTRSGS